MRFEPSLEKKNIEIGADYSEDGVSIGLVPSSINSGGNMPEIIESISPSGKYKRIYPVESTTETIALQLNAAQASQLAVALINATRVCGRDRAVHLTAYRKTGRWTVVVVKAK